MTLDHGGRHGLFEIGVGEDHHRGLATQFQAYALEHASSP